MSSLGERVDWITISYFVCQSSRGKSVLNPWGVSLAGHSYFCGIQFDLSPRCDARVGLGMTRDLRLDTGLVADSSLAKRQQQLSRSLVGRSLVMAY